MCSYCFFFLDKGTKIDKAEGTITRATCSPLSVGTVLQSLNPDDWDSERIDELLAEADSSGDGKLQIQEFLKWIFAEEPCKILQAKIDTVFFQTFLLSYWVLGVFGACVSSRTPQDPKSVGLGLGVVGDFSYVISGCSRADINGVYVQQGKFCSHRPVFFCAANKCLKRRRFVSHLRRLPRTKGNS